MNIQKIMPDIGQRAGDLPPGQLCFTLPEVERIVGMVMLRSTDAKFCALLVAPPDDTHRKALKGIDRQEG